ncbi:hypothetical protein ElyMa_003420900 [Elysia marginata]|uniref:CS domain-containing protein n=1 Tax=Elysia marginata TaxID=1093978 RepID=A0AAV4JT16_9GAST|nr:hypothetical protein ElyMa_003420900 [Elysia marginata]
MAEDARTPTAVVKEVDDNVVSVRLIVEGIQPVMFGDKTRAKNGTVDMKLEPSCLSMVAKVEKPKGHFIVYKYSVKQFPADVDVQLSTWKVKKDVISIKLRKAVAKSWVSLLTGGLEQAEPSSGSEDEEPKIKKENEEIKKEEDPQPVSN